MAVNQANVVSLSASGTNVPTNSYVQLSASTPIPCTKILLVNSTSQIVKLAIGASGSEVDLCAVLPSGSAVIDLGLNVMPVGSRLALEAIGAAATTGYFAVSLIP